MFFKKGFISNRNKFFGEKSFFKVTKRGKNYFSIVIGNEHYKTKQFPRVVFLQ